MRLKILQFLLNFFLFCVFEYHLQVKEKQNSHVFKNFTCINLQTPLQIFKIAFVKKIVFKYGYESLL